MSILSTLDRLLIKIIYQPNQISRNVIFFHFNNANTSLTSVWTNATFRAVGNLFADFETYLFAPSITGPLNNGLYRLL